MKLLINDEFNGPNESNIHGWGTCRLENGVYYATNKFGVVQCPMSQFPNMYIGEVMDEYLPPGFTETTHYNIAYSYDPGSYSLYPTMVSGWRIEEYKKVLMIQALKSRNNGFYFTNFVYNGMRFYYDKYVQRDLDTIMRHIVYFGEYPQGTEPEWLDVYGNVLSLPYPDDFKEFYRVVSNKRAEIINTFHQYKKNKVTNIVTYEDFYRNYPLNLPADVVFTAPTPDIISGGFPTGPVSSPISTNPEESKAAIPEPDLDDF